MTKEYTYICPTTQKQISRRQMAYSNGICPICGDSNGKILCHNEKFIGYYEEQTFWDSLFTEPKFIRK